MHQKNPKSLNRPWSCERQTTPRLIFWKSRDEFSVLILNECHTIWTFWKFPNKKIWNTLCNRDMLSLAVLKRNKLWGSVLCAQVLEVPSKSQGRRSLWTVAALFRRQRMVDYFPHASWEWSVTRLKWEAGTALNNVLHAELSWNELFATFWQKTTERVLKNIVRRWDKRTWAELLCQRLYRIAIPLYSIASSSRSPVLLDGCRVTATWPQTVLNLFKVFRNGLESVCKRLRTPGVL